MEQNRLSRYGAYAIGEIILVVIGIFLAIQLNDWNNERTLERENIELLRGLSEDLKRDVVRLNTILNGKPNSPWTGLEEANHNCNRVLEMTYAGLTEADMDSIIRIALQAGQPLLNTERGVYQELTNTARLYSIGPDSLIRAIKDHYTQAAREEVYNAENADIIGEALDRIKYYVIIREDYRRSPNFQWSDYPWLWNRESAEYRDFQLNLSRIYGSQRNNLYKFHQMITLTEELIEKIEQEIQRRS